MELVSIPETVEEIGLDAFFGCKKLKKLILYDSITKIGIDAFCRCSNLKDVEMEGPLRFAYHADETYTARLLESNIMHYVHFHM